ncbi:MAG: transketolase [Erysipelotrichaceae bacterium]|nr:transketolase [Erysipelotrichaceae bacterium]
MDINELKRHALNVRRNIVQMVYDAQSGHPGGSLGSADILTYLYFVQMDINKDNVSTLDRDRFVLSKGHCSPGLYAILQEAGLMNEDLSTFRQIDSKLQGHPNMNYVAGVDMSTGSLGQGVSTAVGMAIANKLDGNGHKVYALLGDGESEEGIVWEALMAAAHYKLNDLCIIFDLNHLQIDGDVEDVIGPLPLAEKARAFNCNVVECDGNDFESLAKAFAYFEEPKDGPTVIIAHTTKGKGVSYMENNYAWHGAAPKEEDYKIAMEDLKGEE